MPKGEKSFKKKGVVDSVKHCKENNEDKSSGVTKYKAIEKFCESIFCGVVELNAILFCFEHMNGIPGNE